MYLMTYCGEMCLPSSMRWATKLPIKWILMCGCLQMSDIISIWQQTYILMQMTIIHLNLCLLSPPIIHELSPMIWIYAIRTIWIPVQNVSIWRKMLSLDMIPVILSQLCTFVNANRFILVRTRFQVMLQNKFKKKISHQLINK